MFLSDIHIPINSNTPMGNTISTFQTAPSMKRWRDVSHSASRGFVRVRDSIRVVWKTDIDLDIHWSHLGMRSLPFFDPIPILLSLLLMLLIHLKVVNKAWKKAAVRSDSWCVTCLGRGTLKHPNWMRCTSA